MNVFQYLLGDIKATESTCECCGTLQQIDATLPDDTPVRIMQSSDGYHIAVGVPGEFAPDAVPGSEMFAEIFAQWLQVPS